MTVNLVTLILILITYIASFELL